MFTISKIDLDEIKAAKDVLSLTWKNTYGKYFSAKAIKKITSRWHAEKLLLKQAKDSDVYFAAAKDKKDVIVGIITVRKVDADTLFMHRIYVNPKFQGMGVGSQLLDSSLKYFSEARKLKLECEKKNNKACAFYLKKGFKIIGEKDDEVEGVRLKTVVFEKELR
ncbi:GNAT family N-acetyltransferase [Candidatus Roizmanbacteria bacterium]|nr:GNAT family N-acetyltransferase [Candidatus Roizmanbacteria bacterium]